MFLDLDLGLDLELRQYRGNRDMAWILQDGGGSRKVNSYFTHFFQDGGIMSNA